MEKWFIIAIVFSCILMTGCADKIYPTRKQFIQQVEEFPTPDFSDYKSPQNRPHQNSELGLAMSISGGGTRAANFAMGILLGLEELKFSDDQNALQEIDYLSTVSGGGFPAGAYVSSLFDYYNYGDKSSPYSLRKSYETKIKNDLNRSYLAPMISAFFAAPRLWFSYHDEGDVLERAIDDYVLGYKDRKQKHGKKRSILLGDIFIKKEYDDEPVLLPYHVANGTNYENMSIFSFTPDVLEKYMISSYTHRIKKCAADGSLCIDAVDMAYAVGIKASGSFPVAISNTTLESKYWEEKCYLHIFDGGVADNIGYKTAIEILSKDELVNKKVLFIIDADNTGIIKTFSSKQRAAGSLSMLGRLSYSSLDTRHVVLDKELAQVCSLYEIQPLMFSFDILLEGNNAVPPEKLIVKEESERLVRLLKNDRQNISAVDLQILYELCVNVPTKYSITTVEQELLTLTGLKIVDMQKDKILELIR